MTIDFDLLKKLCGIHATSGDEAPMTRFVLDYVEEHAPNWKAKPQVIAGEAFQDCVMLVFGKPRTAVFAHLDSIGFMVKYGQELVKIGGPRTRHNWKLLGKDSQGEIECEMNVPEGSDKAYYKFDREIDRGTRLAFKCDFRTSDEYVQSCYLDNRLGVYNALKLAETLENGVICFSCYEETGGGAVQFLARYLYETLSVKQALISDITWATDGVKQGEGVVISLRDSGIPRKAYLNKIVEIAKDSGIAYQLEVEDAGGSDGNQLQRTPYPFDWCFIGAAEDNVHTPDEKVHKHDIVCMIKIYQELMAKL